MLEEVRKVNPNVLFLLENVRMLSKWEDVINRTLGVKGVHINSSLVSAQNRRRIYWTNIRTKRNGQFGELHSDIPQPADKGILLKDVLEDEVDEKYYLSDKAISGIMNREQRHTEKRNGFGAQFPTVKSNVLLASCLKDGKENRICVAMRGRNPDNPSDRRAGSPTKQRLEPNVSGKTNCLTTVQKDNLIAESVSRVRRLTPTECARLQTIPYWYKWDCSDTQQYKMLGNGWTIAVIYHILSFIK